MTDTVLNSLPITSAAKRWKGVKAAFRANKPSEDQASFHMLNLARTNLGVRLRAIDETSLVSETQKNIHATVAEMLKPPAAASATAGNFEWDEIYKAESLIALLYSGEQLRQEIGARLQELASADQAKADAFRGDYQEQFKRSVDGSNPGVDDSTLRMFLLRIMDALHWSEKKKYLARPLRVQATNRILICLVVSFVLLIIPYGLLVLDYGTAVPPAPNHTASLVSPVPSDTVAPSSPTIPSVANDTAARSDPPVPSVHKLWSLFALYTALTAGLLGAFSSRLYGIQHQWADMSLDEVFLQREWTYTFLRAGVGVCGALIVYIFLRSGIAEGALFPKFDEIRIELVTVAGNDKVAAAVMAFAMPSKALALLTFWCFLAGFSETLVSSILRSTEQELTDAATPAQASRK
jgi:hypothetical protein